MNADATAAALSNYDDETYRFCFFLVNSSTNCERPGGYLSKSDDSHVLNK
jgi:hypothetical protein